jgi:hypothetical protein
MRKLMAGPREVICELGERMQSLVELKEGYHFVEERAQATNAGTAYPARRPFTEF